MKHYDWILQVMWQVLTDQSALFQSSHVTLKFVYEVGSMPRISSRGHFDTSFGSLSTTGQISWSLVATNWAEKPLFETFLCQFSDGENRYEQNVYKW